MTPSTYSPLGQKKAAPRPHTFTPQQDTSSIRTKRLLIAPPDQTEQTLPKEEAEVEEDIPSAPEMAEEVAEEVAEEEEALSTQEEDIMAKTNCSVNTPTLSREIAPRHENS
jgi:hypothetical protein